MTNIKVYDIDAEMLDKMAEEDDESIADVVSRILEYYQDSLDLTATSPTDDDEEDE